MCYFSVFFFKQKTAYEMRISDWSSDVCSSDLPVDLHLIEIEHARPFDELHAKLIILIIIIEGRCVEGQQPVGDRGADARFIGPDRFGFHAGVLARHEIGEDRKSTRMNSSH